jgi:hypothetical protein
MSPEKHRSQEEKEKRLAEGVHKKMSNLIILLRENVAYYQGAGKAFFHVEAGVAKAPVVFKLGNAKYVVNFEGYADIDGLANLALKVERIVDKSPTVLILKTSFKQTISDDGDYDSTVNNDYISGSIESSGEGSVGKNPWHLLEFFPELGSSVDQPMVLVNHPSMDAWVVTNYEMSLIKRDPPLTSNTPEASI